MDGLWVPPLFVCVLFSLSFLFSDQTPPHAENANFSFTKGYGYEQAPNYVNARVSFAKLEHAYLLREFQQKLLDGIAFGPRTQKPDLRSWPSLVYSMSDS